MTIVQKILTLFVAVGAVAGATMMWGDPTGAKWGMEPLLEMLRTKMPWSDIFFRDFIPSSIVLLLLNGVPQFTAAYLLFRKSGLAQYAVLACGIILLLWIALEWWVFGFNALSNIFFVLGLLEALSAVVVLKKAITHSN